MDTPPTIRELMPAGFLPLLCKRTGRKNISNMSQVVNYENTASSVWPEVVKLAKETDPEGYAKWEHAHNSKRAYSAPADLPA